MPRPKKAHTSEKVPFNTTINGLIKTEMAQYCFDNNLSMGELIERMFLELKKKEERAKKRAEKKTK